MDDILARLRHLPILVNECHVRVSVDYITELGFLVGLPCYFRWRRACLLGPAFPLAHRNVLGGTLV